MHSAGCWGHCLLMPCSCSALNREKVAKEGVWTSAQVLHALVEAGEVGRARESLKLFGLPESALQADVSDTALQVERRRCAAALVLPSPGAACCARARASPNMHCTKLTWCPVECQDVHMSAQFASILLPLMATPGADLSAESAAEAFLVQASSMQMRAVCAGRFIGSAIY